MPSPLPSTLHFLTHTKAGRRERCSPVVEHCPEYRRLWMTHAQTHTRMHSVTCMHTHTCTHVCAHTHMGGYSEKIIFSSHTWPLEALPSLWAVGGGWMSSCYHWERGRSYDEPIGVSHSSLGGSEIWGKCFMPQLLTGKVGTTVRRTSIYCPGN